MREESCNSYRCYKVLQNEILPSWFEEGWQPLRLTGWSDDCGLRIWDFGIPFPLRESAIPNPRSQIASPPRPRKASATPPQTRRGECKKLPFFTMKRGERVRALYLKFENPLYNSAANALQEQAREQSVSQAASPKFNAGGGGFMECT